MAGAADVDTLPRDLPVPIDPGAADHLRGAAVPSLVLASTSGASVNPTTLSRRRAWVLAGGRSPHVWYPVFPPDKNAETVLAWPRTSRS